MGSGAEQRGAYHHGNLREALIEASLEILERDGIGGLGLRAAARAAGVSQTAPYHHFGGKEGLLAAVAAYGFRQLQREQEQVAADAEARGLDADGTVRELGVGYVRMARKAPELFKLMFGQALPNREAFPELVEAYGAAYSVIEGATRRLLIERHGEADARELSVEVAAAWATVHGLAILLIDGRLRPGEGDMPVEDDLVRRVLRRFSATVGQRAGAS